MHVVDNTYGVYRYVVSFYEDCISVELGILDLCKIINQDVKKSLELCEDHRAYVCKRGILHFKEKTEAERFICKVSILDKELLENYTEEIRC